MVYAQNFLRLVFSGKIHGVEDFSFGMALVAAPGDPLPAAPTEVPVGIVNAATVLFSSVRISSDAKISMIKMNLIGVDGRYVNDSTVFHEFLPPVGAGANVGIAPQLAYCVSLATSAARGRAHAGRFYLPLPATSVGVNLGTLSTINQDAWKTDVDAFLSAINNAMVDWRLGVVSNIGLGVQRYVTHARYGRVLDTMRSRREKFDEAYIDGVTLPT